jgi:hypothetical protein
MTQILIATIDLVTGTDSVLWEAQLGRGKKQSFRL